MTVRLRLAKVNLEIADFSEAKTVKKMSYPKFLDEYDKERNTGAFYDTQAFKKLWRSIIRISKTVKFQEKMSDLRKEFQIPSGGFLAPYGRSWTHPPTEWALYESDYLRRRRQMAKVGERLREVCIEYDLPPRDFVSLLEDYLFYNELLLNLKPNSHNLIYVTDLLKRSDSTGRELADDDIKTQPIAILVSPYATSNDIVDYVRRMYMTEIRPLQEKHRKAKSVIGKQRKSDPMVSRRDQFIYEHRNLAYKKLVAKVNESFPKNTVDEGSVGKIISREIKKRQ